MSEFEPIHRPWHIDVGEHNPYVFTCLQNDDCFVGVGCFNSRVTCTFDKVDRVQSAQKFVLNHQHVNGTTWVFCHKLSEKSGWTISSA